MIFTNSTYGFTISLSKKTFSVEPIFIYKWKGNRNFFIGMLETHPRTPAYFTILRILCQSCCDRLCNNLAEIAETKKSSKGKTIKAIVEETKYKNHLIDIMWDFFNIWYYYTKSNDYIIPDTLFRKTFINQSSIFLYDLYDNHISAYYTKLVVHEHKQIKDQMLINFISKGHFLDKKIIRTFLVIRLFLSRKTKT